MAGLSERMVALGSARSEIREAFAFAQARAAEVGPENVDDFSIGNPSVPAPESVGQTITRLVAEMDPVQLHGYTPAQGDPGVRQALADELNARYGTAYDKDCFYLTVGAAAALCCALSAMGCPGDEFITFAPYFPEYKVFVESAGGRLVAVPANIEDFQIDFAALDAALNPSTKAVIINSPNNPTGVVYSEATIRRLGQVLAEKSKEYGHTIYLISDEPYREIVYGAEPLPWVPSYYANTLVCYSYSKSLSLPGERIGYVYVPQKATDGKALYSAVAGAARAGGHVCAPSLWQKVIARCAHLRPDLDSYNRNRLALYEGLSAMGYEMAKPDGAFYLFVKAPGGDANRFSELAKQHDLLLVPGDGFGCPGYFRVCYCVSYDMIKRSLPVFEDLIRQFR